MVCSCGSILPWHPSGPLQEYLGPWEALGLLCNMPSTTRCARHCHSDVPCPCKVLLHISGIHSAWHKSIHMHCGSLLVVVMLKCPFFEVWLAFACRFLQMRLLVEPVPARIAICLQSHILSQTSPTTRLAQAYIGLTLRCHQVCQEAEPDHRLY